MGADRQDTSDASLSPSALRPETCNAESVQVDVLGGGRISHDPAAPAVHVFGYSSAFGPAPHEVAAGLLRRWLPLHTVTTSYEGY